MDSKQGDPDRAMVHRAYYERSLATEVYPHLRMALEVVDSDLPKMAVDVGCGSGRETLFLLEHGYNVYAYDISDVAISRLNEVAGKHMNETLFTHACRFDEFEYPESSVINACSSLFFCDPTIFHKAWAKIVQSLMPGGVFCGHFMGPKDSWAKLKRGDLTVHSRSDVQALFDQRFRIVDLAEFDEVGCTLLGRSKHWHTYSVVARKMG